MALLPSIAAGVPIDEMQSGQSVRLRTVFYDNGSLATGGRAYFDNLPDDDKVRFLDALRARRQLFRQQQTAIQATEATPSLEQLYQNAFAEIAPVLDRYASNEKIKDLASEAPAIRLYLSVAGLHPRNGAAWLHNLSEEQQTRVLDAIADRNAIQRIGARLVAASKILANPANDLSAVASRTSLDVQDLRRIFTESGLTERGAQYVARLRPERQFKITQNVQLRNLGLGPIAVPEIARVDPPTNPRRRRLDTSAGEGPSHRHDTSSRASMNPHEALGPILNDLGKVPMSELQQRVGVPLSKYFVPGEGITEKGFHFLKTLDEHEQTRLQLALLIPRDVMTFYEVSALLDRYESGVAGATLRQQMPNFSSYLTEGGGLGGSGGTVWFRHLPPDRQARIARAIENRRIITATGPRFAMVTSTFSNPANDMDSVARRAGVSVEQLARFLTEDGLTPLGQRFLETCDARTRQVIEANIALRRT